MTAHRRGRLTAAASLMATLGVLLFGCAIHAFAVAFDSPPDTSVWSVLWPVLAFGGAGAVTLLCGLIAELAAKGKTGTGPDTSPLSTAEIERVAAALGAGGAQFRRLVAATRIDMTCTGLTATWCPLHGDCTCPELYPSGPDGQGDRSQEPEGRTLSDPTCPLHGLTSDHAETTAPAATTTSTTEK